MRSSTRCTQPIDRVNQAYNEFSKLDGKFHSNVVLQIKNGPLDFQPREPFHPLFGAMPHTHLAIELQITQEYLGASIQRLAYLGPLYQEVRFAPTPIRLAVDRRSPRWSTPASAAAASRSSPASPIPARTAIGPAILSPPPTGTHSADWPGIIRSMQRTLPTSGRA